MTFDEFKECQIEADRRMKECNGHKFITILKTRCYYCGRNPGVKTRCGGWFHSFLDHLSDVMFERKFIE